MQENLKEDSVTRLRTANREELLILRKKDRENALRQKRLKLCEIETLVANTTLEQFKELVLKIKQKNPPLEVLKAVKNVCRTPAHSEIFFKTVGAFDSLVRLLIGRDALLQLEAAACFTNLACGSHKASRRIANGAGAYLVSFINGGSHFLQDQSAWTAGNIANDCLECYTLLQTQGLIPALIAAMKSPISDVIQSTVFALHSCTKYGDSALIELGKPEVTKLLLHIVAEETCTSNTCSDAAFALANICCLVVQNDFEIDTSMVGAIVTLLHREMFGPDTDVLIVLPLIRCLGFLSTKDVFCQSVIEHPDFCSTVNQILKSEHKDLKREILWVLSNVSSHSKAEALDYNLICEVAEVFLNPLYQSVAVLQALYCLSCLASQNEEVKELLHHPDIILRINTLLQCGGESVKNASKVLCDILQISV